MNFFQINFSHFFSCWRFLTLKPNVKLISIIPNIYVNHRDRFAIPSNEDLLALFNQFFARKFLAIDSSLLYQFFPDKVYVSTVIEVDEFEVKNSIVLRLILDRIEDFNHLVHSVRIDGDNLTMLSKETLDNVLYYRIENSKRLKFFDK